MMPSVQAFYVIALASRGTCNSLIPNHVVCCRFLSALVACKQSRLGLNGHLAGRGFL